VIDGAGRIAKQHVMTFKGQLADLSLQGLRSGLYVIVATTENGQQLKNKIIVKY
jgi:hypothetical protein